MGLNDIREDTLNLDPLLRIESRWFKKEISEDILYSNPLLRIESAYEKDISEDTLYLNPLSRIESTIGKLGLSELINKTPMRALNT